MAAVAALGADELPCTGDEQRIFRLAAGEDLDHQLPVDLVTDTHENETG
jgi:hypothetical protein